MWQHVVYNTDGSINILPAQINQMVQGNGRYSPPAGYGAMVQRVDLQSDAGSSSTIWNSNWYEPWRGSI